MNPHDVWKEDALRVIHAMLPSAKYRLESLREFKCDHDGADCTCSEEAGLGVAIEMAEKMLCDCPPSTWRKLVLW